MAIRSMKSTPNTYSFSQFDKVTMSRAQPRHNFLDPIRIQQLSNKRGGSSCFSSSPLRLGWTSSRSWRTSAFAVGKERVWILTATERETGVRLSIEVLKLRGSCVSKDKAHPTTGLGSGSSHNIGLLNHSARLERSKQRSVHDYRKLANNGKWKQMSSIPLCEVKWGGLPF